MTEAKIYVPNTRSRSPGADLQPDPSCRDSTPPGRRRVSIYVCWSFPGEANRNVYGARQPLLDHDGSPPRGVAVLGTPEWADPTMFQQGIAGALELFFRAWMPFQQLVGEITGHVVPVFQRVDQAGTGCRSTSACSPTRTRCSCSASTTS